MKRKYTVDMSGIGVKKNKRTYIEANKRPIGTASGRGSSYTYFTTAIHIKPGSKYSTTIADEGFQLNLQGRQFAM